VPSFTSRSRLALTTAAITVLAVAVPLTVGSAAAAPAAHRSSTKTVIVYLRGSGALPSAPRSRVRAARAAQAPVMDQMRSSGATHLKSLRIVDAIVARVSAGEARALAHNPNIKRVIPDSVIRRQPLPAEPAPAGKGKAVQPSISPSLCGTSGSPQLNPEALSAIHATPTDLGPNNGTGVKVAYMADGIDTTNVDLQRNAAYASPGSPTGSPVVTEKDFTGDGSAAATPGGEAFIDGSSVVAQGNHTYDLSDYMAPQNPLPAGCDIKIVGAAPGASMLGLKVFAEDNATTGANFIEAIDYAARHGVKVLNQSFGGNDFPATAQDSVLQADRAVIAAGVTVVASTGDSGITSTIGTPSSDPKVIAVEASTTFREYEQEMGGGTNVPGNNGQWVNNNVSGLSSGGFTQMVGRTADLLAPGDLNWGPCSTDTAHFTDCTSDNGAPSDLEVSGGTSESSPLTAAAAADVITAYASTHGGNDPSPAQVKRILTSTATDVFAPASQGGAGLLNVKAAVHEAKSMPGTSASPTAGILLNPGQINTTQQPGTTVKRKLTVTNNGPTAETVNLSTRALTNQLARQTGSFCMQPNHPTTKCPANTGKFFRETGAKQVYQAVHFTVPSATGSAATRLIFDAAYRFTGQNSVLKVALLEPDGTYAAYSIPQGLADFADTEVANPPAGQWTAVLFTTKTSPANGVVGTSGPIKWSATTDQYQPGDAISPATLHIPSGTSKTATLKVKAPTAAGDADESVVVNSSAGTTTVPVTVRTVVPMGKNGGHFHGVLTGGNGRDNYSQNNAYEFDVPKGTPNLRASVALKNDAGDGVIAGLVDPQGQVVAFNTNQTTDNFGRPANTKAVDLYAAHPQAGRWRILLTFLDPITGKELREPFTGKISLQPSGVTSTLPRSKSATLRRGSSHKFTISVPNKGRAPQGFFVDPRRTTSTTFELPNLAATANGKVPLPMAGDYSTEPTYVVPSQTSALLGKVKANVPVTFDIYPGLSLNPDIAVGVKTPGATSATGSTSASLAFSEPAITPGVWFLDPSEIGPYGASGAPAATATVSLRARMQAFDRTVTSSTGDFWTDAEQLTNNFAPRYVPHGDSTKIQVRIKPTAKVGSTVHGTAYVDAVTLTDPFESSANEVVGIPYSYTVGKPKKH
jgi:hypothetical protein